jgi:hypothetical protein
MAVLFFLAPALLCCLLVAVNAQPLSTSHVGDFDVFRPAPPARADDGGDEQTSVAPGPIAYPSTICGAISAAAAANGLPFEFFARVIWQESRFKPDALGPLTRSGARAQGIAQFMPGTAAERMLLDPFDPLEALPKSAAFLRELQGQFGNLGLAAAAYNAGPQRVRDWLSGKRALPPETQNYVRVITGRLPQQWTAAEMAPVELSLPHDMSCLDVVKHAAKPTMPTAVPAPQPVAVWAIQLFGDRSETKVLAQFRELQRKHQALLANREPEIARTIAKLGSPPVWARLRIEMATLHAAQSLCSSLKAAGEDCLVQRN